MARCNLETGDLLLLSLQLVQCPVLRHRPKKYFPMQGPTQTNPALASDLNSTDGRLDRITDQAVTLPENDVQTHNLVHGTLQTRRRAYLVGLAAVSRAQDGISRSQDSVCPCCPMIEIAVCLCGPAPVWKPSRPLLSKTRRTRPAFGRRPCLRFGLGFCCRGY